MTWILKRHTVLPSGKARSVASVFDAQPNFSLRYSLRRTMCTARSVSQQEISLRIQTLKSQAYEFLPVIRHTSYVIHKQPEVA